MNFESIRRYETQAKFQEIDAWIKKTKIQIKFEFAQRRHACDNICSFFDYFIYL